LSARIQFCVARAYGPLLRCPAGRQLRCFTMLVDWPVTDGDNRKGGQGTNDHAHEGVFAYQDFYGGHERIENPLSFKRSKGKLEIVIVSPR
jgi:hypothetical protein